MVHSISCGVCHILIKVNGQKQIDTFLANHRHGRPVADSNHIELDNPTGRKVLGLDK